MSDDEKKKVCGIVRPIAQMGDYTVEHWNEVHRIFEEAAGHAGFQPVLVSESEDVNTIMQKIVTNLYENDIVIVDVSGRNPNVMFELGMRVAFQKPVVVVKDELTPFTFDISSIKHIPYPASLHYYQIKKFTNALSKAISATVKASKEPNYKGYLQQFGPIHVTGIEANDVPVTAILEELRQMKGAVSSLSASLQSATYHSEGLKALNSPVGDLDRWDLHFENLLVEWEHLLSAEGPRSGSPERNDLYKIRLSKALGEMQRHYGIVDRKKIEPTSKMRILNRIADLIHRASTTLAKY